MTFRDDLLLRYMSMAPLALAFERFLECQIYTSLPFAGPVLDLGCGDGVFAHVLFREQIDTGVDPNPRELERARELGGYAELIACSGSAVPKPDGYYRTVFSNSVLEHIEALDPIFQEVYRLLAPGGRFYFTVPSDRFDRYALISRLLEGLGLAGAAVRWRRAYNSFWRHYHYYAPNEWAELGRRHGFDVAELRVYAPPRVCALNDALVPLGFAAAMTKRLANRWVLFPALRRLWMIPLCRVASRFLRGGERADQGGLVFVALQKGPPS